MFFCFFVFFFISPVRIVIVINVSIENILIFTPKLNILLFFYFYNFKNIYSYSNSQSLTWPYKPISLGGTKFLSFSYPCNFSFTKTDELVLVVLLTLPPVTHKYMYSDAKFNLTCWAVEKTTRQRKLNVNKNMFSREFLSQEASQEQIRGSSLISVNHATSAEQLYKVYTEKHGSSRSDALVTCVGSI